MTFDPFRHRCSHLDRGQQCGNAGSLTTNTVGPSPHPGPWYCAKHFPPFLSRNPETTTPPPDWLPELVEELTGKRTRDPLAWARRIADAPAGTYPRYSVQSAREALKMAPLRTPDREAAEERIAIMLEPTSDFDDA